MADNLETKYYWSGDEPMWAANPEHIRIYGHMLCPFVQRAWLSFGAKQIPFQKVHVDMENKAKWHTDFNTGLLPVLQTPKGDMLKESDVIFNFAYDFAPVDQGLKLYPSCGAAPGDLEASIETAQHRLFMKKFDAAILGTWFGVLRGGCAEADVQKLVDVLKVMEETFKTQMNGKNWLSGRDDPMMIDVYCYPLIERCELFRHCILADKTYAKFELEKNMPTLFAYYNRFREHPFFKDHCVTHSAWATQVQFWTDMAIAGKGNWLTLTIFDKKE